MPEVAANEANEPNVELVQQRSGYWHWLSFDDRPFIFREMVFHWLVEMGEIIRCPLTETIVDDKLIEV